MLGFWWLRVDVYSCWVCGCLELRYAGVVVKKKKTKKKNPGVEGFGLMDEPGSMGKGC
jgi:hypothetical protein